MVEHGVLWGTTTTTRITLRNPNAYRVIIILDTAAFLKHTNLFITPTHAAQRSTHKTESLSYNSHPAIFTSLHDIRDTYARFSETTLYFFHFFLLPLARAKLDRLYCYIGWIILDHNKLFLDSSD